jgi:hypothetical protein
MYFRDIIRSGLATANCFQSAVEGMARKYAQFRELLLARHGDNENYLYEQLGNLNQGFEKALRNAILWFLHVPDNEVTQCAKEQLNNSLDSFFERFIESIRQGDFNTAFILSMKAAGLSAEESNLSNTIEISMERRYVFNIKGGQLIVTFCEDGIMSVRIVKGGNYGYTNEELLGNINDYEEPYNLEGANLDTANDTTAQTQIN